MNMSHTRPIILIYHHPLHTRHIFRRRIIIGPLRICFRHQFAVLTSLIDIALVETAIEDSIIVVWNYWDEITIEFIDPYDIDMVIDFVSGYIE